MPISFIPSNKAANAPALPNGEGIYDGKFFGVSAKAVKSQFADIVKDDKGKEIPNSYEWGFTLLDDDGKAYYLPNDEPFDVTTLTSRSTNVKSKTTPRAVKVLKALMTADEWEEFEKQAEMDEEELAAYLKKYPDRVLNDADLVGRIVELEISVKESGWPQIDEVRRKKQPRKKSAADDE